MRVVKNYTAIADLFYCYLYEGNKINRVKVLT